MSLAHAINALVISVSDFLFASVISSFDRDFLQASAMRAHLDWPFAHRSIDTHTLAYMHIVKRGLTPPSKKHHSALNLDAILKYVGVPEEPKPHNAMTGALSHAEVISRLLYDRPLLDEFKNYPMPPNFNN